MSLEFIEVRSIAFENNIIGHTCRKIEEKRSELQKIDKACC